MAVLHSDGTIAAFGVSGDKHQLATELILVEPIVLAYGPQNTLHVFDRKLNAVAVFDSTGTLLRRVIVPLDLRYVRDLAVSIDGNVHIAGYAAEHGEAQLHVLCEEIHCYMRSMGSSRPVRDSLLRGAFQSGFLALSPEHAILAHINPLWIESIRLSNGHARTIVLSDELPDAESTAVRDRGGSGSRFVTTQYSQVTGLIRAPNGELIVSAFLPQLVQTLFLVYSASGESMYKAALSGFFAVKDYMPSGDILVVRQTGRTEVVQYRIQRSRPE